MTLVPLRTGPLIAEGFNVRRSGIRWLCEDGHICRPGEAIAYCNISLVPIRGAGRKQPSPHPFPEETRDFQIAFAPNTAGRLRIAGQSSLGGFLDRHTPQRWAPDDVIGHLKISSVDGIPRGAAGVELRMLVLAGRRTTEIAEVRSGLLTGWHDRVRACWGDGAPGTVLSLGICELTSVIRGERSAFLELFEAVRGPVQVVAVPDDILVPSTRIVIEQFRRRPAQHEAMAADFAQTFPATGITPAGKGWMLAGALMQALQRSPLRERYSVLTRTGVRQSGPADAVILSLNAEPSSILRHKKLGYSVQIHRFRLQETGPAIQAWLRNNFEPVKRTLDDIHADYRELIDAVSAQSDMKFLIVNTMSTSGYEDIVNYAPIDRPMGDTLASIRAKEINLMLHDLARERDISIVDADAIVSDLGAAAHFPDGVHGNGIMQAEVRGEILRILRERGIAGFSPRPAM